MKKVFFAAAAALLYILPVFAAEQPFDRAAITGKTVALTIENVGTAAELERVMRLCNDYEARVTFFIRPDVLGQIKLMAKAASVQGHEFGSYGTRPVYWGELDAGAIAQEIEAGAKEVEEVTGIRPSVLRPPFGYYGQNLFLAADMLKEPIAIVRGLDTGDWTLMTPQAVVDYVSKTVVPGAILNINMKATNAAAALPAVLDLLKKDGYKTVTVSQLKTLQRPPEPPPKKTPPQSAYPFSVIRRVETDGPVVALTFDDEGLPEQVENLLDILKENQAKATFFLVGRWARNNPELVRRINAEGHELANHSFSHPRFSWLAPEEIRDEMARNEEVLQGLTGQKPKLFRPPYGDYNHGVITAIKDMGYRAIIMWDVDTRDWSGIDADAINYKVMTGASPGSIILFHLHAANTPGAIQSLVPDLRSRGYSFVTVSELIG